MYCKCTEIHYSKRQTISNIDYSLIKKGRSNLTKGDIAQLTMLYAKEILSICPIIFARWQHTSRSCSWWVHSGHNFCGRGGRRSDGTLRKSNGSFLYRLSTVAIALSNHSAAICHRMSPTLKSLGWLNLSQKR